LWGSPVYDWQVLKADGFKWWLKRMEMTLSLFDVVRIDHFRGLVAYWEIGAWEKTAINGRWVEVPVVDFLNALKKRFFYLPIIAEDLGVITPDVREVMRRFNLPGMKVLLFAFGEDHPMHPYLPHVYDKNCIVYTGTHDNNTARGWFEREATDADKKRLWDYLGKKVVAEEVSWELIRLAMMSVADMAVFPLQDLLNLGEEARLNTPSTPKGNWEWRVEEKMLTPELAQRLKQLTYTYGRL
jgi:4-alpha-glucanotransferase